MHTVPTFRRPFLVTICTGAGWVILVSCVFGTLFALHEALAAGERNVYLVLVFFLYGFATFLVFMAIAQTIEYIGRCAFHAERIDAAITEHFAARSIRQQEPPNAILDRDDRATAASSPGTAPCPLCRAPIVLSGLRSGLHRCWKCRGEFSVE